METHARLAHLLEQGRLLGPNASEFGRDFAQGWNASIDNAIRAIALDSAYLPVMERAAGLADAADIPESEMRLLWGDR
jgi:hypothetical protein